MIKRLLNYRAHRRDEKRESELANRLEDIYRLIDSRRALTPDKWQPAHDYLKSSEKSVYDALAVEHHEVCKRLGKRSEYFNIRAHGSYLLGEDSPKAYISVRENTSTRGENVVYNDDVEEVEIIVDGIVEE